MEKALPIVSAIFPLLVAAVVAKFPKSDVLFPVALGSFLVGWISLVVSSRVRLWLRVVILVIYPFVTLPAMWLVWLFVAAPHFH